MGMVATIDRVGTVRIEKRNRNEIEHLTFNEIVNIIDGQVLGGNKGITRWYLNLQLEQWNSKIF